MLILVVEAYSTVIYSEGGADGCAGRAPNGGADRASKEPGFTAARPASPTNVMVPFESCPPSNPCSRAPQLPQRQGVQRDVHGDKVVDFCLGIGRTVAGVREVWDVGQPTGCQRDRRERHRAP